MSGWNAKRFWKTVDIQDTNDGFQVVLDNRPIRTPAKRALIVPSRPLASEIAREWDAQSEKIDPSTMPYTRTANSALDKVAPQMAEVVEMLAAYGDTDLLCYRADSPMPLVERQQKAWDPMLEWAKVTLGATLNPIVGLMHQPQNPDDLERLSNEVKKLDHFELAGFHDLVTLSGSLVIALAVSDGVGKPEPMWEMSILDEIWQAEQWGQDADAALQANHKRQAFLHAAAFLGRSRVNS